MSRWLISSVLLWAAIGVCLCEIQIDSCPPAADISPCTCGLTHHMDCSLAISGAQIESAFQAEFPQKEMNEFLIIGPSPIVNLNFSTNGVSFSTIMLSAYRDYINTSPSSIETISESFLIASADRLHEFRIEGSALKEFPFEVLSSFTSLRTFSIDTSEMTELPPILAPSLYKFIFTDSYITTLNPGVLDALTHLIGLDLDGNNIRTFQEGSIPFGYGDSDVDLNSNPVDTIEKGAFYDVTADGSGHMNSILLDSLDITELVAGSIPITRLMTYIEINNTPLNTIQPGAFYVYSEPGFSLLNMVLSRNALTTIDEEVFAPIMPYLFQLEMYDNPLECGCDIAWLVTDYDYLSKISSDTMCTDGTPVVSLDPNYYEENC